MSKAIHISTLRKMLQAGDPVDISLWKKNGEIIHFRNAVPLRYDFYKGTRRVKLLDSREIRTVRDVCIFEINGMEVFL